MNNDNNWLVALDPVNALSEETHWDAGFDANRQLVYSKLGPYQKIFPRPADFVQRFYHTLYPLPIEEWRSQDQVKLYDDFCTIDIVLDVRFQATYSFALSHREILTEINEYIKQAYHDLAFDIVHRELLNLSDGLWVQEGLTKTEQKINRAVAEMLMLQNIQSQVICSLKAYFEEFPDVQFAKERVYLYVMKKNHEFKEQQREEEYRQAQESEIQKIQFKREQIKHLSELAALDRERQAVQAENSLLLLEERKLQQQRQLLMKKSIHEDRIRHQTELEQLALDEEIKLRQLRKDRLQEQEKFEKDQEIEHQSILKTRELQAQLEEYERKQTRWREVKNKIHSEELDDKYRRKQLEFDVDLDYKQRYEQKRLQIQQESLEVKKDADKYLQREIELLKLDKERLELELAINANKEKNRLS
jgi:hypothetical protein